MPELPEVETTVRNLNKKVLGRTFVDVWTDFKNIIKKPESFEEFKNQIRGRKIRRVWRRGKNILLDLSGDKTLLIHQKLTGHLLYGTWGIENGIWKPSEKGPLEEKVNTYIHLLFNLDNGKTLALSDLRKFAKAELLSKEELGKELSILGPELLEKNFTFEKFKETILKKKGKIKQVLMDQTVIAGIGNIYSDEILWEAKIHPFKEIKKLSDEEIKKIYEAIKKILNRAIKLKGDSMSDYRLITGEKGGYQKFQKVYRQEGNPCKRLDGGIIKRVKIGGRSAHFCPICQKM